MLRSSWESVSPSSWLGELAGEEALMSGLEPSMTTILFVPSGTRARQGQQQESQGQEAMETEEAEQPKQPEEAERPEPSMDEDFFMDLPVGARLLETSVPSSLTPPSTTTQQGYAYYTYSYSNCATLDDQGQPVESTRKRYQDSAGRLKAMHRRAVGNQWLEKTWLKTSAEDEGKADHKIAYGNPETFETKWKQTPFGRAEAEMTQSTVEEEGASKSKKPHAQPLPDEMPTPEIP